MSGEQSTVSRAARLAFGLTALIIIVGLVLNLALTILNVYPADPAKPSSLGYNDPGMAGLLGRVVDFLSYFTILSNIVVAAVLAALLSGRISPTFLGRALRMDSLVMITVTGLIFAIVLAPDAHLEGLQYVTNTIEHYLAPVLTIATWLIWGPRGWFRLSTVPASLVLPVLWLVYTFIRGAAINAYPYGFIDVVALGYPTALRNVLGVLAIGIVLGLVYWGLDRLLSRRASTMVS